MHFNVDEAAQERLRRHQAVLRAVRTVERFFSWAAGLSLFMRLPDGLSLVDLRAAAKLLREYEAELALFNELAAAAASYADRPDELAAYERAARSRAARGLVYLVPDDF